MKIILLKILFSLTGIAFLVVIICSKCKDSNSASPEPRSITHNRITPKSYIGCYQCEGPECRKPNQSQVSACKGVDPNEQCYRYFGTTYNLIHRGCTSDDHYVYLCNLNVDNEFCRVCNTDECNGEEVKVAKCYECLGSTKKCKGPDNYDGTNVILCTPDDDGNDCFTHKDYINVASRGCAKDKKKHSVGVNVDLCVGDMCNNKPVTDVRCIQCNEADDPDCATMNFKPGWIGYPCPEFSSVCYTKCLDGKNKVIRGCGQPPARSHNCTFCYDNCVDPTSPTATTRISTSTTISTPSSSSTISTSVAYTMSSKYTTISSSTDFTTTKSTPTTIKTTSTAKPASTSTTSRTTRTTTSKPKPPLPTIPPIVLTTTAKPTIGTTHYPFNYSNLLKPDLLLIGFIIVFIGLRANL